MRKDGRRELVDGGPLMSTVLEYLRERFDAALDSAYAAVEMDEALVALSFVEDALDTAVELVARGESGTPLALRLETATAAIRGMGMDALRRMTRPFWEVHPHPDW